MTKKNALLIISIILLIIISILIYYFLRKSPEQIDNNKIEILEQKIIELQEKNDYLTESNANIADIMDSNCEPEIIMPECPDYNLPAVSYGRAGLLTDSEKANLIEKFLQPFVDYYNDMPEELISVDIMVPANPGEEYEILAIFTLNDNVLRQGFLFAAREEDYDYWLPTCMDECEFSDEFAAKYPEIVAQTP